MRAFLADKARRRVAVVVVAVVVLVQVSVSPVGGAPGDVEYFSDPSISEPFDIVVGPDGALWFTNRRSDSIGRITTDGELSTFTDPSIAFPYGITVGPDGALWFTNYSSDSIGRITTEGVVSNYTDPSIDLPARITAGPDGALWFTRGLSIGRITTEGAVTIFEENWFNGQPSDIVAGPDGNIWFTTIGPSAIVRLTPEGVSRTWFLGGMQPRALIAADGALWTVGNSGGLTRVTTEGDISSTLPSESGSALAVGPDGAFWVASNDKDELFTTTIEGENELFAVNVENARGMVAGPDGSLWVAGTEDDTIVRFRVVQAWPDPPTGLGAVPADGGLVVSWTPTVWEGDEAVESVTVTATPGGASCTGVVPATSCVIEGLVNDDPYTLTARSTSPVGSSVESEPVGPVWPSAVCGPDLPGPFVDVVGLHPFCRDIWWASAGGVTSGYPDGTYRPAVEVSRQAMAAFLYRLAGEPAFEPPSEATFVDVAVTHPFFAEIEWAAATGVADGFADGTYRPAQEVSRQAMAAFLYRLAGEPAFEPPSEATFVDVGVTHRFFVEIEWAAVSAITAGYPDGSYRPAATITRQATAAFLHRYDDLA